ncbi:MAG: DUF1800 domain-containing protein [Actinomycetia bacterium]|nr:DUF1800 domain-containing protein [Actinomycetes bacterium]
MKLVERDPGRSRVARLLRRTSLIIDTDLIDELSERSFDEAVDQVLTDQGDAGRPPREGRDEIISWWVDRMISPSSGLYERMVWFWHTHLTTSHTGVSSDVLVSRQLELLRIHALGNFRDLLQAFVVDGALLQYLDGDGSEASNPNENLARELMELFTVGLGNHSEDDVRTAARALAGWVVDRDTNEVRFERERSFIAPLLFRGKQANFDTAMIVDHLCDDVATAAYVSNKLWHYLAGGWLDSDTAVALGRWWQSHNLEIRPLVEAIVTHPQFEHTYYSRPRTGLEFYTALASVVGVQLEQPGPLRRLGQVPYEPPNVAGWPTDNRWLEPGSMLNRGSLVFGFGFGDLYEPMPGTIDHVLDRCGLFSVTQDTLDALNRVGIGRDLGEEGRAQIRWRLALSSPEFQLI